MQVYRHNLREFDGLQKLDMYYDTDWSFLGETLAATLALAWRLLHIICDHN